MPRSTLGLGSKTWLFNNPNDAVPYIPHGFWTQVQAAAVFNPVSTVPSQCPFIATTASTSTPKSIGIPFSFSNPISNVYWQHNIARYVWQMGTTCVQPGDALWPVLWPLGTPIPVMG